MAFTYPLEPNQVEKAKKAIEDHKHRLDFESVITRAIRPRLLRVRGWSWETWDDREPLIENLLSREYNPKLCDVLVDPNSKKFHDWTGRDVEDKHSPVSKKGHDEIRRILSKVIAATYPDLDDGVHKDLRFGCESLLFFYFRDTHSKWWR